MSSDVRIILRRKLLCLPLVALGWMELAVRDVRVKEGKVGQMYKGNFREPFFVSAPFVLIKEWNSSFVLNITASLWGFPHEFFKLRLFLQD